MNKKIEKIIIDEVKSQLSDIDFDKIVDPKRIKDLISEEIDREIISKITSLIQSSIIKEIQKRYPIINKFIADEVRKIIKKVLLITFSLTYLSEPLAQGSESL